MCKGIVLIRLFWSPCSSGTALAIAFFFPQWLCWSLPALCIHKQSNSFSGYQVLKIKKSIAKYLKYNL